MYKQIAENKRRTVVIMMGFVLMVGAIAALFAWAYGDWRIAFFVVIVSIIYAIIQYFAAGSLAIDRKSVV